MIGCGLEEYVMISAYDQVTDTSSCVRVVHYLQLLPNTLQNVYSDPHLFLCGARQGDDDDSVLSHGLLQRRQLTGHY